MNRPYRPTYRTFAILLLTLLVSMPQVFAESASPVLARIMQNGKLVLGTAGNMPPMTQTREDGRIVGFDIDLARLMANGMGVKLDIRVLPFDTLLPTLQRGEVDIVISNVTMNPKRNMHVAFVGPYLTSGKCIITKREDLARAKKGGDLNVPETRLAALKGSTSADVARELFSNATLTLVDDHEVGIKMIQEDKIGGLLTDHPICQSIMARYPDAGFVSLFSLLTYEPIGIALPGTDPLYINWTENFLKRLEGMGVLKELGQRWLRTDSHSTN
ncbi:MAG: transporter substrate-binding domain-containing protein [Gammaproteobacteria bacterium]|nr:transporter substrate-binding domain-containing protein [Gammaproteobacteria bacterium]